jgi:hypothetical protein
MNMPRDRKLPNESLRGQIVFFQFNIRIQDMLLLVEDIFPPLYDTNLILQPGGYCGRLIAYNSDMEDSLAVLSTSKSINMKLLLPLIDNYRIVDRKELPLYIGYPYTNDLLAQLIRGDFTDKGEI